MQGKLLYSYLSNAINARESLAKIVRGTSVVLARERSLGILPE